MTAMAVVPLRTASHIPRAAWIAYIFTVAMASLHFTIGLSQGAESIMEGAALFAPIVSTASAYLMSLLITINWREAGFVVYELA
ncbi:hypothetical protein Neosp_000469 [[Neocosmospora] mangrovei]